MLILTALLLALTNSYAWAKEFYLEVNDKRVPKFSDQVTPGGRPIITRKPSRIQSHDAPTKSIKTEK